MRLKIRKSGLHMLFGKNKGQWQYFRQVKCPHNYLAPLLSSFALGSPFHVDNIQFLLVIFDAIPYLLLPLTNATSATALPDPSGFIKYLPFLNLVQLKRIYLTDYSAGAMNLYNAPIQCLHTRVCHGYTYFLQFGDMCLSHIEYPRDNKPYP